MPMTPIDERLPVRARSALRVAGCEYIEDAALLDVRQLARQFNCGMGTVAAIRAALRDLGLRFASDPPPGARLAELRKRLASLRKQQRSVLREIAFLEGLAGGAGASPRREAPDQ
jgi:hypothetical protein